MRKKESSQIYFNASLMPIIQEVELVPPVVFVATTTYDINLPGAPRPVRRYLALPKLSLFYISHLDMLEHW